MTSTLLLACGAPESKPPAEPLGTLTHPLSSERHHYVTRPAVEGWVNEDTVEELDDVSTLGDNNPDTNVHSETHFDNCYWDEGRDWVLANREAAVVAAVAFASSGSDDDRQVYFDSIGYVFHAVQDHYAHANWVETHEPGELAPLDIPGEPAPPGWISGTHNNPGDTGENAGELHCPAGTPSHADLNKDAAGTPEADEAFFDAVLATTDQMPKLIAALREALPDGADATLSELGFIAAPTTETTRSDEVETLTLEAGSLGFWTPALYCPEGSFVSGFAQRVEEQQDDEDDSGLNAVALVCTDESGARQRLSVWEGLWGDWSEPRHCPDDAPIFQARLKVDPPQDEGDDTAASAVAFGCSDGSLLQADNDAAPGEWGDEAVCPSGSAVCGLSVQYQPPQGAGDDTALNSVQLRCCTDSRAMGGVEIPFPSSYVTENDTDTIPRPDGCSVRHGSGQPGSTSAVLALVALMALRRRRR